MDVGYGRTYHTYHWLWQGIGYGTGQPGTEFRMNVRKNDFV